MASQSAEQGAYAQLESNDAVVSRLAEQDKVPWYSKPNLRHLYFLMCPTCLGVEMTSGFATSMTSSLQAVPSWLEYYHHPRSASLGLVASMYSLGCVTAVPFAPLVVDRIGRRHSILLGCIISITGGLLQGSALNFVMFIVARFVLGFADNFCVVAASSLVGELSHPKERAVMGSLFNSSWYLGAVSATAVILGTFAFPNDWGWRIPSFLQVVPSLLQVSFIWFLPESPRWLISKGRRKEAYTILTKYHAEGDENSEFVRAEYTQIEQTLEAELRIVRSSQKDIFSTPGMRKRVIVASFLGLFTQWSGVGLIAQYLAPILDSIGIHDNRTKNIINFTKYCWGCTNSMVIALVVPQYPRRRIYLASTISLFVVFTAWTVASAEYSLTGNKVAAQAVLVLIFLYNPAYNLALTALTYTFLVELFPFHVRTRGITVFEWWSRGGAFFNLFVNPIGMEAAGWRWYIIYCVWNAFQVVFVYFMFPETSGRTLEELTFLYEDEQEVFGQGSAETLRGHGETETYGTMERFPRITVPDQQGQPYGLLNLSTSLKPLSLSERPDTVQNEVSYDTAPTTRPFPQGKGTACRSSAEYVQKR